VIDGEMLGTSGSSKPKVSFLRRDRAYQDPRAEGGRGRRRRS
jgi:hypothetical protein